jgi:predicted nucleic acid-binding protein
MNSLVLIDSSVWVEVSRKDGSAALKEEVAGLLRTSRTAMTWPVWVELHQGAKGRREEENLRGWRELSRWLEFDDDCWTTAATTLRTCLRAGLNVPFADILIHSCSERYGVRLLERDRHFARIREAVGV